MSINSVEAPYPIFTDIDGNPLESGYIYIGEPNQNPEVVPISAFWDSSLTTPASQPIRTIGGYPSRSGTAARVYVEGDYSVTVRNKNGTLVYNAPVATGILSSINSLDSISELIGYTTAPENTSVNVSGYYIANDGGGGLFNWDSTIDKSTANAGTIIDPSVSLALQGTGVGLGAWVRQAVSLNAAMFASLQDALNSGHSIYAPGSYNITETLHFTTAGQRLHGDGKEGQTVIENDTNSNPLFAFSTGIGAVSNPRCSIEDLEFVGNVTTTEGVALRGILDDGLTGDADKSCSMLNVRIRDIGAGFGLRVSSWSNTFVGLEIWDCDSGLKIGSECNSCTFNNPYITGCTNGAVLSPNGPGIPSNNTFIGGVYQRSGGTTATIHIEEGHSITFTTPYTEGNTAPYSIYFDTNAHNCSVSNIMHNTVSISPATHIIAGNAGKINSILGVQLLGGTIQNMVKIIGALPITTVGATHISAGTVTGVNIDDASTRKATVILDGLNGSAFGPSEINALQSLKGWKYTEVDTGTEKFSIKDGKLYIGDESGGSSPAIKSAGGTIQFVDNAGTGPADVALNSIRIGSLTENVKMIKGAGTPEGVVTADSGSTFHRTDGGAGTSFYVKESGDGTATGWIGK